MKPPAWCTRTQARIYHGRIHRKIAADVKRVEAAADPVCSCGWITGRDTCPMCGGVVVQSREAAR